MTFKLRCSAFAIILLIGPTPRLCAQPVIIRSRIQGSRVPVIVVKRDVGTARSRVFISDTDLIPDTVYLAANADSKVELESAIALLAGDRANRSDSRQERGAMRNIENTSRRASWLPASDQRRLTAFINRLEVSGTHCRRSNEALRDRCLPLALPSGSLFGQMRRSRRFTLP